MHFQETKFKDLYVVDIDKKSDNRGFFARTFCAQELEAHGLRSVVAQCNLTFNPKKGTLRGMHYQTPPAAETKLVRCIRGGIYDVIVDMRPDSSTYLKHFGIKLTQDNYRAIYIPEMFAHGYQTLRDNTEVMYQVSEFYTPGYEQGFRYDDPTFKISWPLEVTVISEKDTNWSLFTPSVGI